MGQHLMGRCDWCNQPWDNLHRMGPNGLTMLCDSCAKIEQTYRCNEPGCRRTPRDGHAMCDPHERAALHAAFYASEAD